MKAAVLFSGGKDSTYAALAAKRDGELECVITLFPESDMSYMFHYPNLKWTSLQAESMGIPQVIGRTKGVKEEELSDLREAVASAKHTFGIDSLYTGALASVYQKTRVERVCDDVGLRCVSPFWHVDPELHLRNLLREGFVFTVVSVSALGLDESWLGRVVDERAVEELAGLARKYRFHAGLEGGEGETFVLDCPIFSKRVELTKTSKSWRGDSGVLEIEEARLAPKPSRKEEAASSRAQGLP